jgi:hypothetical protein
MNELTYWQEKLSNAYSEGEQQREYHAFRMKERPELFARIAALEIVIEKARLTCESVLPHHQGGHYENGRLLRATLAAIAEVKG